MGELLNIFPRQPQTFEKASTVRGSSPRTEQGRTMGVHKPIPACWAEPLQRWTEHLTMIGRRRSTLRNRLTILRGFARHFPDGPAAVNSEQIAAYLSTPGWGQDHRSTTRVALGRFYGWAMSVGLVDLDPTAPIPMIPRGRHMPRPAPDADVAVGLAAADPRAALMVLLGYRMGLRIGEIVQIKLPDDLISTATGQALYVRGKGGRDRIVPVPEDVLAELRTHAAGWLFPGRLGHLSRDYACDLVSKALPGRGTSHMLRHAAATRTLAYSHDVQAVQRMLGHASLSTTQVYLGFDDARLRDAMAWQPTPPPPRLVDWPPSRLSA